MLLAGPHFFPPPPFVFGPPGLWTQREVLCHRWSVTRWQSCPCLCFQCQWISSFSFYSSLLAKPFTSFLRSLISFSHCLLHVVEGLSWKISWLHCRFPSQTAMKVKRWAYVTFEKLNSWNRYPLILKPPQSQNCQFFLCDKCESLVMNEWHLLNDMWFPIEFPVFFFGKKFLFCFCDLHVHFFFSLFVALDPRFSWENSFWMMAMCSMSNWFSIKICFCWPCKPGK